MNKDHNLDSQLVFLDLIKAFELIHHALLFILLKQFSVPETLINVIKKLYRDFKIEIKVEEINDLIDYKTGVKQGDNLAPFFV